MNLQLRPRLGKAASAVCAGLCQLGSTCVKLHSCVSVSFCSCRATLRGVEVAVKFVAVGSSGDAQEEQLKREVQLHRKAKHPSIVDMVGLSKDPASGSLVLVLELMPGGDLLALLKVGRCSRDPLLSQHLRFLRNRTQVRSWIGQLASDSREAFVVQCRFCTQQRFYTAI